MLGTDVRRDRSSLEMHVSGVVALVAGKFDEIRSHLDARAPGWKRGFDGNRG